MAVNVVRKITARRPWRGIPPVPPPLPRNERERHQLAVGRQTRPVNGYSAAMQRARRWQAEPRVQEDSGAASHRRTRPCLRLRARPHRRRDLADRVRNDRMGGNFQEVTIAIPCGRSDRGDQAYWVAQVIRAYRHTPNGAESMPSRQVLYIGITGGRGDRPAVAATMSASSSSICGLWNATSLATRRMAMSSACHCATSAATTAESPEITVDSDGPAAIAAQKPAGQKAARPPHRRARTPSP